MDGSSMEHEAANGVPNGDIRTNDAVTDERWRAIVESDGSYDGIFFYAVVTTGIFCRPSCRSKPPNRRNVVIFRNAEEALRSAFRPCKRCKPAGERRPEEDWAAAARACIDERLGEPLTLERIAAHVHGSPYHLQRTFKRVTGMTPAEYIRRRRIERAMELLARTELTAADIGRRIGLPNAAYFVTWFKHNTGSTPATYRSAHAGIEGGTDR